MYTRKIVGSVRMCIRDRIGGLFFIGQVMAFLTAMIMSGVGLNELIVILSNPISYPEHRLMVLTVQGMSSLGGFIIAPLIFYYILVKGNLVKDFIKLPPNLLNILMTTVVMVFSFMVVNTVFIEWNAELKLPEAFSGVEEWATNMEDSLKELTEFLTRFDSMGYFMMAIVVVAVIPGIGEELLFRGLLQNILVRMFKNTHVAIWVAAIFFSAVHFQFYGFLPRLLLGALFGYLYVWTGNLLVPIVAHFLTIAASLLAL